MVVIDINQALLGLAGQRPIFHSEADFQHALAWQLQTMYPDASLRLERPHDGERGRIYLDIWLRRRDHLVGIELKYKTRRISTTVDGESYRLKNQSAQDIARYDFLKDVVRVESLLEAGAIHEGIALFLTNDSAYWRDSGRRGRVDEQFRLHEGRSVTGTLGWAAEAADGTTKSRERPLVVRGTYFLAWSQYATAHNSDFRYLMVVPVRSNSR